MRWLPLRTLAAASILTLTLSGWATAQVYSSTDAPKPVALTIGERADIFMARHEYLQALDLLKDGVKQYKKDASLYNRMGIAYQQLNNLGQSEKYYKKAIKLDKKNARYHNNLGTVYYMRRKMKDAIKQFNSAIQIDPTQAAYFVNLGGALFYQRDFQPALTAYRAALRIDPNALFPDSSSGAIMQDITGSDTPRFHYDLSRLFCSMGMLDDAVHQFRQAYEQHYKGLKGSLTDPEFAPLRLRPEYRTLMGLPPLPLPTAKGGGGGRGAGR
jgi:tetratricopeptide (TPR) repeat protein